MKHFMAKLQPVIKIQDNRQDHFKQNFGVQLSTLRTDNDDGKVQVESEKQVSAKKEGRAKQRRWKQAEDFIYINYMRDNLHLFENEATRRANRVFLKLSKVMEGSRSPNQCKSHHQKMQKVTHKGCPLEIIKYLQKKYSIQAEKQSKVKPNQSQTPTKKSISYLTEVEKDGEGVEIVVRVQLSDVAIW